MEPYLPANFEVCRCYGFWVSLLQPDPQEKEEDSEEEHEEFVKIYFAYSTHILHQITSKFW